MREGAGCAVLVVDDHVDIRETLAEILEFDGFSVATAGNGAEALDYLRGNPHPQLIILDLVMPLMNGLEFRRVQTSDPSLAGIPVAVVSGADETEQRSASLSAVGYFVKPVDLEALLKTVRKCCSRAG